jgi:nucleoside-diphosphate-sugar epimerase
MSNKSRLCYASGVVLRVLFIGGTGPVGQATIPHLLSAGHEVAIAHTGAHEPDVLAQLEHLHGGRAELLAPGGPAERWRPELIVDTFAGGATAAKGEELSALAQRSGARQLVAVSSMDVYRHCADAGVDGHEPASLARDALPLREDAPLRTSSSPVTGARHDNVAMENALQGAPRVTILRPGAIYGPHQHPHVLREWYLVGRVTRGERDLPLPDGGTQLFHRVALARVGRSIAAAVERAPEGRFECNVGDPRHFTYGALASLVADRLDWSWEPRPVAWSDCDHPWNVRHPVLADTARLRDVLGVLEPGTLQATLEQIDWLWEHRELLAEVSSFNASR